MKVTQTLPPSTLPPTTLKIRMYKNSRIMVNSKLGQCTKQALIMITLHKVIIIINNERAGYTGWISFFVHVHTTQLAVAAL